MTRVHRPRGRSRHPTGGLRRNGHLTQDGRGPAAHRCRVGMAAVVSAAAAEVPYAALGGTVTAVRSTSFEALSARGHETSIQIRASWSALGLDGPRDPFLGLDRPRWRCVPDSPYYPGSRGSGGDLVKQARDGCGRCSVRPEVALHNPVSPDQPLIRKDSPWSSGETTLCRSDRRRFARSGEIAGTRRIWRCRRPCSDYPACAAARTS